MTLSESQARDAAAAILAARKGDEARLDRIDRYIRGEHDRPWQPKSAGREYLALADRARTNWLPLVVDVLAQDLIVEGYRLPDDPHNAAPWAHWQANGLDARQLGVHRATAGYGWSYGVVLPGLGAPVIRGYSPRRMVALYDDPTDDEWPTVAGLVIPQPRGRGLRMRLYDDLAVYELAAPADSDRLELAAGAPKLHQLGVCPVVRFVNRFDLDGRPVSEVEPLIPMQDRINETVFGLLMAQTYAAFRQRWATGLAIPTDPVTGEPVEPFSAAVDRLWHATDPAVKFGEFQQTDLSGHLSSLEAGIRHLAAVSQTPPQALSVPISNLSAEALAALQQGHERKVSERKALLGQAWKQVFRLAALAAGDPPESADPRARVIWRDTEARSLAQTVDALGKLAQMLGVPPQALWERVPGVTTTEVEEWRALAAQGDPLAQLSAVLDAQAAGAPAPAPAPPGR